MKKLRVKECELIVTGYVCHRHFLDMDPVHLGQQLRYA